MGVVQKGPTLTLFFGPQKTSFFRLFSTFLTFLTKRNRPTDATFDKNRSKNRISKNPKKTIKKKDRPKKSKTIKKRPKNEKSIKTKIPSLSIGPKIQVQKSRPIQRDENDPAKNVKKQRFSWGYHTKKR